MPKKPDFGARLDEPVDQEPSKLDFELAYGGEKLPHETQQAIVERNRFGAFTLTDIGLNVDGIVRRKDWQDMGDYIFGFERAVQWLIGDWLVYGEQRKWGDIKKIADERGHNYQSLRMYAHVSRNVFMRINTLTWNHHLLVAKLKDGEQENALRYAADNNLTVKAFAEWLRGDNVLPSPDAAPLLNKDYRFRFSRVFRNLSEDTLERIHEDDIPMLQKWLDKVERHIQSRGIQLKK
jgi:hypothetical protein